ncbi:AAA family ATPase [Pedobacter sp. AW31-3R]|uniref:AAA family ATPase n=1 Tax=Pedobacter sp. AW31-3R TaxID=3445781 RepID=UPI003F9F5A06
MLIQFSATNYRSIGEKQVLSLLPATNQKDYLENIFEKDGHKALNLVALYGANGSGKSNLLKAMEEFIYIIEGSSNRGSKQRLWQDPFLLREGWDELPTTFEMVFCLAEVRFRYGFSYNDTHILTEWLFSKGAGREVNVFQREKDVIDPSSSLKGNTRIIDAAIEATKDNALFLAALDALNVDVAGKILQFCQQILVVDGMRTSFLGKMESVWGGDALKEEVTKHLKRLKLGLIDVKSIKDESARKDDGSPDYKIFAEHRLYDKDGKPTKRSVKWDYFEKESSGSVKALEISGPTVATLVLGGILIIDEIEAKMHPLLTLDTINLFLNKETNPKNAQLIFSTHDTNLLTYAKMRRDQIYFVEKNHWESTEIYSLSDFVYVNEVDGSETKERPDTDKEKRYIEGRYGAVPVLGPLSNLIRAVNG